MRTRVALIVIVAIGVLLRIRALFTEFWLDEIWSLRIAQEAHSIAGVFRIPHDNNHLLNTMFMVILGDQANWIWYRSLAFVCGLALIALLIRAARNDTEKIIVAILASLALPMIVYSTEARGYAPAAMLCVLAYVMRERPWIAAIAISIALFAHLTAVFVLVALIAETIESRKFVPYLMPSAIAVWLYFVFVKRLTIGGGAESPIHLQSWLITALAIIAITHELTKRDDRVFFIVMVLAPVFALLFHETGYLHPRYLFVCLPFAILLLASYLSRFPKARIAVVAIWIAINTIQLIPFLRYGRGTYIEAMMFMRSGIASGDNDFRNGTVLDFYRHYAPELRHGQNGDWYLIESFDDYRQMPRAIRANNIDYQLARVFPYGGVSGWHWLVYRRAPPLSNPASIHK